MWQGKPLYQVVVEHAWQLDIRGATVLGGIEGFGPEHHLSTERFPDIAENLPLIIEVVDSAEDIERLPPELDRFMQRGMITVAPVVIIAGSKRLSAWPLLLQCSAREVAS